MSFFGINGPEFVVLLIVVVIVLGPARAAQALVWLQKGLKRVRDWSAKVRAETAQLNPVDKEALDELRQLDPRQLDPRKMIRDAVAEEMQAWMEQAGQAAPDNPKRDGANSNPASK